MLNEKSKQQKTNNKGKERQGKEMEGKGRKNKRLACQLGESVRGFPRWASPRFPQGSPRTERKGRKGKEGDGKAREPNWHAHFGSCPEVSVFDALCQEVELRPPSAPEI